MKKITVALISPSPSEELRKDINATGLANVVTEVQDYCLTETDSSTETIVSIRPDIVIVDVTDAESTLACLGTLRSALPQSHLLVLSSTNDSRLIIAAMRAGAREFLEVPVSESALREALERYAREHADVLAEVEPTGALYSIIAGKLSSGATTVAINTANAIADATESSTFLVDLDIPLGDAAAYLNLKPQYTVQDALASSDRLDSHLLENFTVKVKNTPLNLLGGFREYTSRSSVTPEALEKLMKVSRQTFRHTVVDLSGSFDSEQAVVVAKQSATILVVLTPDLPAIWRTEKLLTFLTHHGAGDKVRLILNRTSKKDDIGDRDIERLLSHPVFHALPNDYTACLRAINSGRPLQPEDSRSLYGALHQLALQMTGAEAKKDSRGLLGMFLRPSTIGG